MGIYAQEAEHTVLHTDGTGSHRESVILIASGPTLGDAAVAFGSAFGPEADAMLIGPAATFPDEATAIAAAEAMGSPYLVVGA